MNLRFLPGSPWLQCALLLLMSWSAHAQNAPASVPALINPKDVFADIPREVMKDLKPGSAGLPAAFEQADKQIKASLKDKPGTFQIKVRKIEELKNGYAIVSVLDEVRIGGMTFPVEYTIMPDPSQNALVAKLKPGNRIKASGNVYAMLLYPRQPMLRLEMYQAVLVK